MKNEILKLVKELSTKYKVEIREEFSANSIASKLNLSRNAVSSYLNEFVSEGEIMKIVTRPVCFYSTQEIEEAYEMTIHQNVFASIEEFMAYVKLHAICDFKKLIGANGSLKHVVEQCKATISYPPLGLPILLHGPTGCGKSLIASLMYEFAKNNGIIEPQAKFISINCSEYANNPELITANLFGHKKGAFTGADKDNLGLIHMANGGVLFLDEVHCLKAECQEKLFQLMDQGIYHMVGDNENYHTSSCRIIFATTENPQEVLLSTLQRRIPIFVDIPGLNERPDDEKKSIIYHVFRCESHKIHRHIAISKLVYQALMNVNIVGNVGGLKNCIKATCANAFLNKQEVNGCLEIYIYNLPDKILSLTPAVNLKNDESANTLIHIKGSVEHVQDSSLLKTTYEHILSSFIPMHQNSSDPSKIINELVSVINQFSNNVIAKDVIVSAPNAQYVLKIVDKIFSIAINRYSLRFSNNHILLCTKYILEYNNSNITLDTWYQEHKKSIDNLTNFMLMLYPKEYNIALEIKFNCKINLDIELDSMSVIVILLYILSSNSPSSERSVIGLILCHGYSTASSIATTVNKLLDEYIFDAIDMELTMSTEKMIEMVRNYVTNHSNYHDLCLLVDMGSLEQLHKEVATLSKCNVGIINNVTTRLALEIGNGIQNKVNLVEILQKCLTTAQPIYNYIPSNKQKDIILCSCATGVGSAEKITELLLKSLPIPIGIEIRPYDYQLLLEEGLEAKALANCNVLFIIGTINPNVEDVPYIAIEQIIMNDSLDIMSNAFSKYLSANEIAMFNENIVKTFTLNNIVNHLTILNAQKVLEDVEDIVDNLEKEFAIRIPTLERVGLYMHLACLIERLIMRSEIIEVDSLHEFTLNHQSFINKVKNSFSVVGYRYSVEIPVAEIIYIYNYLKKYDE